MSDSKTICDNTAIYETTIEEVKGNLTVTKKTCRVPIDLTNGEIAKIAVAAHERNLTLNEFIIEILESTVTDIENSKQ